MAAKQPTHAGSSKVYLHEKAPVRVSNAVAAYAELAVTTNFSFLRGASHPHEMVETAIALGLTGIGITDRNSFAGVVRAYAEAKDRNIKFLVGTRLVTIDGFEVLTYPKNREAYGRLCRLLTDSNRKVTKFGKGECHLTFDDIISASEGQIFIVLPPRNLFARLRESGDPTSDSRLRGNERFNDRLSALVRAAPGRTFLAGVHDHRGDEPRRLALLNELGEQLGAPLVAINDVLYHAPERRILADVVTCIREKCTIAEAGYRLNVNAERHIKPPEEMARLFRKFPDAIARTIEITKACHFSLGQLEYEVSRRASAARQDCAAAS